VPTRFLCAQRTGNAAKSSPVQTPSAEQRRGRISLKSWTGTLAMRLLPPHYFFAAILLMGLLHVVAPGVVWLDMPWTMIGIVLIVAGLSLPTTGAIMFHRRGTAIKPFNESSVLVVEGPYRFTRNPMYIGLTLMLIGVATVMGTLTPLFVIPIFVLVIDRLIIRVEEQMLEAKFGEQYRVYKARVRRWV